MTFTVTGTCKDGRHFGITLEMCDDSAHAVRKACRQIVRERGRQRGPVEGQVFQSRSDGQPEGAPTHWRA